MFYKLFLVVVRSVSSSVYFVCRFVDLNLLCPLCTLFLLEVLKIFSNRCDSKFSHNVGVLFSTDGVFSSLILWIYDFCFNDFIL